MFLQASKENGQCTNFDRENCDDEETSDFT